MHRLTCNDADRLAGDLDRASVHLYELAATHRRYGDGLAQTGDFRWSEFHYRASESARDEAEQLKDYAKRLRDRTPLWTVKSAPKQIRARRPDSMKAGARRRAG